MKIIENNIIPFNGFLAINLFGLLFVKEKYWKEIEENKKKETINHELIHTHQMRELLFIPFYIIYGFEFLIRFLIKGNGKDAYKSISFEKEAYAHQEDDKYLTRRKHFAQWRKD